jgi:predicted dithiol-disulfide oxidoreductase (DUF899 family)
VDPIRFPNETPEYRKARDQLLEEEAALRERVERVAALRRELPLGGEISEDYVFEERDGSGGARQVKLSQLFRPGRDSLLVYGFMYGPEMEQPCPMCTSFLDSLDGAAPHITQQLALAVSARSPIDRIARHAERRGWRNLRLLSSAGNGFQRDYRAEDESGSQLPMANVFVQREGRIHHFWGSELFARPFPNGNPRHVDMLWPLWNALDLAPEGRGERWYPALDYETPA